MRISLLIATYLLSISCFAAHVTCYSSGHIMYDGEVYRDFYMTSEQMLLFKDKATKREIFVMASDCVFKV